MGRIILWILYFIFMPLSLPFELINGEKINNKNFAKYKKYGWYGIGLQWLIITMIFMIFIFLLDYSNYGKLFFQGAVSGVVTVILVGFSEFFIFSNSADDEFLPNFYKVRNFFSKRYWKRFCRKNLKNVYAYSISLLFQSADQLTAEIKIHRRTLKPIKRAYENLIFDLNKINPDKKVINEMDEVKSLKAEVEQWQKLITDRQEVLAQVQQAIVFAKTRIVLERHFKHQAAVAPNEFVDEFSDSDSVVRAREIVQYVNDIFNHSDANARTLEHHDPQEVESEVEVEAEQEEVVFSA